MWAYQHIDRNDIMHYGVPGMKLGQRRARTNEQKAVRARAKGDAATSGLASVIEPRLAGSAGRRKK